MAEIYSKIGTLRNNVSSNQKSISSTLQTVMLNGQCTAGVRLSNTSGTLASLMASADTALCSAYASAASMVKSSSRISAVKYPVNVTLKKNAVIKLNYTVLEQCAAQLSRQSTQVNNHIAACTNLITELNNAKMKTAAQQAAAKVTNVAGGAAGVAAAMAAANQKAAANTLDEQMKFDAYKSTAITQINNAKKYLTTLSASLKQVIKELQTSVNAFKAADSKISKIIADFNKTAVLKKASAYDKATSTNAGGIQTTIAELEAAQKEYVAAYGHPSEEIAEEIVRLKKLVALKLTDVETIRNAFYEKLGTACGDWLNQHNSKIYGANYCQAVSYAIGLYMVTGQVYDPRELANSKAYCYWNKGHVTDKKDIKGAWDNNGKTDSYQNNLSDGLKDIYNNLLNGYPSAITYYATNGTTGSGTHTVVVTGIRQGADVNNLKPTDLIIINPADGKEAQLGSAAVIVQYRKFY
ncbi:MAG: hypothetical protein ACI4BB_00200 [Coprococcus sp.]